MTHFIVFFRIPASVLGGLPAKGSLAQNADNIFTNGAWSVYGGGTSKGCPTEYGILICLRAVQTDSYYFSAQLFIARGTVFYYRSADVADGYQTWHKIIATE